MSWTEKHQKLEKNSIALLIFIIIAIMIGGLIEVIPLFRQETVIEPVSGVRPYTPLELIGQNVYMRENCAVCHSQQIRPLRDEVVRYGHYSLAVESMYDYPFQWGSKRTGPDLARVGGKYSDDWHTQHLRDPRSLVPESIMPTYEFLMHKPAAILDIDKHMKTLKKLGVPYTDDMIKSAKHDAYTQAAGETRTDTSGLMERYGDDVNARDFDGQKFTTSEMDALVAYLQVLGTMVDFSEVEQIDPDAKLEEIQE